MNIYYSAKTGGFYDTVIHGDNIPVDAVEITAEEHEALLEGQSSGKQIRGDENGRPILVDPPAPTLEQLAESVRSERDSLLAETDHMLLPDYPITPELLSAVQVYRQALRDITEHAGFPETVEWPVKPEGV